MSYSLVFISIAIIYLNQTTKTMIHIFFGFFPAFCKKSCLNGGRCIEPGKCRCPLSYFGQRCENGERFLFSGGGRVRRLIR